MSKPNSIAPQTRNNWLIDAVLFIAAGMAALTGIYFLFFPVGGYQGGRNPSYGITILFDRRSWDNLHTWFGILMILAALVHIIIHWKWIRSMVKRSFVALVKRQYRFNARSRNNLLINLAVGLSFLLTAVSGIYLFFIPGGYHGVSDPAIFFTRTTWDLLHTWAGIILILTAVTHFAIHWRWVGKVTSKMISIQIPVLEKVSN